MQSNINRDFSKLIEHHTNDLIQKEFAFKVDENTLLYHFTKKETADKIIQSQVFLASFIRSTSDSLEFALPLSYCRDWLCLENRLFDFSSSGFPSNLFSHFNEQAIDPIARYYFISLTEDQNSEHHLSNYGDTPVKFSFDDPPAELSDFLMILRCHYPPDLKQKTFELLDKWKQIFFQLLADNNLSVEELDLRSWFYMLMRFCHMISLCLKQGAFENEKEVRIVFVPLGKTYDSDQRFHAPRGTLKVSSESLLLREYLPLKLNPMGITTS